MPLRSVNELDNATDVSVPVDIRGWELRTTVDDEKVGSVHDVLVDETGAARYLDVDLGLLSRHVLLPVGQAETDPLKDVVWAQGMDSDSFHDIPAYDHDLNVVNADFERRLTTGYDRGVRARYHRPEYGGAAGGLTGVGSDPTVLGTEEVRLRRLSELDDYEVADHDSDPRGWSLVGAAGEKIGEVGDLIVDPQAMKARYLDVELDRSIAGDRQPDHVLIPVGYARLDDNDRRVRVDVLSHGDVGSMPRFDDDFDDAYEERIDRHFSGRFEGAELYRHPRYDAERFYAARIGTGSTSRISEQGRICDVHVRR